MGKLGAPLALARIGCVFYRSRSFKFEIVCSWWPGCAKPSSGLDEYCLREFNGMRGGPRGRTPLASPVTQIGRLGKPVGAVAAAADVLQALHAYQD